MSDYRYNPNSNNYPKTSNRSPAYSNRSIQGRPVQNRSTSSTSTNRQLQNKADPRLGQQNTSRYQEGADGHEVLPSYKGFLSTEGSNGSEGAHSSEGTQSSEGSRSSQGLQDRSVPKKQKQNTSNQTLPTPPPQTSLLDFSDLDSEDILRGLVFSEILGRPKALRRGRW